MGLWSYVSNIGLSNQNKIKLYDPKRLIFFNQVLFIGLFATLFQVLAMWPFIGAQALSFLVIPIVAFLALYLNHKGYQYFSKRLFMLTVYLTGVYTTTLLGGAGLYHLGALVIFVSGLVIFDFRTELLEIILGIPLLALILCIGELGWFNAPDFSGHEGIYQMRISSILNLGVIITILMIFILRLNHKNEEKLLFRGDELESIVKQRTQELIDQKSELEKQNDEKEILLKEVHHRVKNNLQIIVSLINLQLSKSENPQINHALHEIQGRVLSMSLAHQKMYQASDFTSINLERYIDSLIENVKGLYFSSEINYSLNFDANSSCDVETAIPIGLIFNEVISNFFKHVSNMENASFEISLSMKGDLYELIYTDNGEGFPENFEFNKSESLGLQLIDSLTEQIDGQFRYYNENGAVYKFEFKKQDIR